MSIPGGPARPALAEALALFQAGRMAEAERAARQSLAAEPQRPEAHELLGAALAAQGRPQEALASFDRARALRPQSPSIRHNRAQALFALGRLGEAREDVQEATRLKPDMHPAWNLLGNVLAGLGETAGAERAYRRALALRPDHAETQYNLALLFQNAGRLDESIACYRKALQLRPNLAAAHNNLANALKAKGRAEDALAHYAQAVRFDPQLADAYSNWGTALREMGRVDEAIALLERAAAMKPRSAEIQNNLGIAYFERNRFREAVDCQRRALALEPGFHESRNNLGNALAALGEETQAIACYEEVLAQLPQHADAHSNLGLLLQERGDVEGAIGEYERTLAIRPDHADALNNYGYLLQEQGRREEAMALYRRAMEANPRSARAAYNLGLSHLCRFEFGEGWRLCELRYHTTPPVAVLRPFRVPAFTEADWGKGHRIAIWREQGIGDQLLYSTLLPELEARGESFVLEIDKRLVPAYRRAHPGWNVVPPEESEKAFAGCDRHLAIASLPRLLRPARESFERQPRALLAADPDRASAYRERLRAPGVRVIGISWRSFQPSPRAYLQKKKSGSLAAFHALSQREDIRLLDLQYGDTAVEREAFARAGGRLTRLDDLDLFGDLEGVLAAVEACDAIVTTSNVTAHYAGVLGKPAYLMYLHGNPPFHYWVPDAEGRSLWYPAVRIVTRRDIDTWEKALAAVDELLHG
ncbi:MAG: tetratricopeptide repeat protein [Betaproteobacteria bacterium]